MFGMAVHRLGDRLVYRFVEAGEIGQIVVVRFPNALGPETDDACSKGSVLGHHCA
jgi:hypothetical protein